MKKSICIINIVLFIGTFLHAQEVTIPFQEDQGIMYVKMKVNNHEQPLNFVFDTGASSTVLDSSIAEKIGVKANGNTRATGASGSASYQVASSNAITFNNLKLENITLILTDLSAISRRSVLNVDGIIGNDILKSFYTSINYEQKQIYLYKSLNEIDELESFKEVDFVFKGTPIPKVEIKMVLKNGESHTGMAYVDTGARLNFLMNTPFVEKHRIKSKIGKSITNKAQTLTTSTTFVRGTVNKLQMAGFNFGEMPVSLAYAKSGVSSGKQYMGILGSVVLRRFHMIFDYQHKKMYLKPNRFYKEGFIFPRSGFSMIRDQDKILIERITAGSEAQKIGIQAGEELIAIDGKKGNLAYYRKQLNDINKKQINIRIRKKDGSIKEMTLQLKRLI